MPTIDSGTIAILTYRDGVLSRLGHDLRLIAERFAIDVDDERRTVTARVVVESIVVEGAVRDGVLDAAELSSKDQREILDSMRTKVLQARRNPYICFEGTIGHADTHEATVRGQLTLTGVTRAIELELQRQGQRLRGTVTLVPSRWGIRPYKALLGALRLQDRVDIVLDLPDPGDG
jgi:polyisoprenoid-binding protein YceI